MGWFFWRFLVGAGKMAVWLLVLWVVLSAFVGVPE